MVTPGDLINAAIAGGLITAEQVAQLRIESRQRREPLLDTITVHGRFPLAAMYRALAETRGLPFIDLETTNPSVELVRRVPEALLRKRTVLPVREQEGSVLVAATEPDDRSLLDSVSRALAQPVQVALADPDAIQRAFGRLAALVGGRVAPAAADTGDTVALLDRIIKEAFLRRASDIHLEPEAVGMRVRLRIDGRLQQFMTGLMPSVAASLVSRVKVLANLDISEQRAPQDGRFSYRPPSRSDVEIDFRVATVPTRWGERATLRLLGTNAGDLTLASLGMSDEQLQRFREMIRRPYGIVLLTGPTGSGKSTTLYGALREINRPDVNIMTVEDPIEYLIPGVNQVHVGGTDKVTFASSLRSLLRHDPDVLMVGEIRDHQTADIALKAALTGHLLFSTLHTNSACGAVTRLVDLGCEPYLVGATLVAVIAQRLVRRLCPHCKHPQQPDTRQRELLRLDPQTPATIYTPRGCARCLGSGFLGRIGLFEPLWIDIELSQLISSGASQAQIERHVAGSLTTLRTDGYAKVLAGVTSLEEVLTVTVVES